jgi:hypothetical protein
MRFPHPKTCIVGALAGGLIVLFGYFAVMWIMVLPRAEATIDRVAVRVDAPGPLAVGERAIVTLRLDNRGNTDPVRFRDVLLPPEMARRVRIDGAAVRAQGASLEAGPRIVWDREVPGGGAADLALPFEAREAGRYEGVLLVLFEVPRLTKGRSLPLTLEIR